MKRSYRFLLIVILLTAAAGIIIALYYYNLKDKDLLKVDPEYSLTAEELVNAFEKDENAASTRYINKVIEVSGKITSVNQGVNNTMNISLEAGNSMSSVICTLTDNSRSQDLKPGKMVVLRGECSGYLLDVLLNNCVVTSTHGN